MSSKQQTASKSFTCVYLPFLWMMILHPYTWYLNELLVLMIFLTDLVLNYSDQYLFVYVRIFSGVVFFLSDFLLEIVHLLVGILLNPLIPKKTHAQWEYVFSCICFNLLISVFVAITRLGIRSFTGGSPEKLKYIDPNVEMTL